MPTSMISVAAQTWRVVVVDDSQDDRAEVRRLLLRGSDRRYKWTETETGAAAIRAVLDAPGGPPECVVLDYNLPDMDAVEVLAALVGPDGLSVCPVVVLTGSVGHEHTRAVLRAGAQDYLGKGWMTPESLTRVVENAAERWAMARELRGRDAALRASEERFRLSIDASPSAVVMVDQHGVITMANPELERLSGYGRIELVGQPVERLLPDELRAGHATLRREYFRDPAARRMGTGRELQLRRRDGTLVAVEIALSPRFPVGESVFSLAVITDVTARKAAEEQLRRNHETFVRLIENNPFGMYIVDADFRLRQVSLGAQKVFSTVTPLIGRDFDEILRALWPEPFATDIATRFRHTLATGEPYRAPSTVERRQDIGEVEAYDWRIERLLLPDGRFGVVCYFYDLTERQRWETALSAKECELRALADNSPDILTRFDRGFRHVFVNAAVERATGRPREEFLGKTNRELGMPADLCDLSEKLIGSVFEKREPASLEFTYGGTDATRYYAARFVPEFGPDGAVEFVLGVTHDVTDRKRAEDALRTSEERLARAQKAAGVGTWDWDIVTGQAVWTEEAWVLFGPSTRQGPVTYDFWLACVHPDDRAGAAAATAAALSGDGYHDEFRVLRHDGSVFWLESAGAVVRDTGERPVRLLGTVRNVTDRKMAEKSLHDADRRKDEFLATLAHELRNPLAPIRNGLQVLRLGGLTERSEKTIGMMERQLGHMINLVDDLLDVSRVRSGKITLRSERVTARQVVDAAVEACRPTIDAKRHTLEIDLPEYELPTTGDKTRLVQVVSNLLTNSAKYSEPGARIRVTARREGSEVVLVVADTGVGIAPELLPTLWDIFTQVRDTLDKAQGGLGIGLSLVKKLVEMHGGTVTAQSDGVGTGSAFTVRLPLVAQIETSPLRAPEKITTAESRPTGRRVLVVDDNADAAESLAELLQISGHETTVVHSGSAVLGAVRKFAPALVILDIGLPGLDGYEVARQLKADPKTATVVLVALTGWGSEDDKLKAQDAGFDFHLTKPVDTAKVLAHIATLTPTSAARA